MSNCSSTSGTASERTTNAGPAREPLGKQLEPLKRIMGERAPRAGRHRHRDRSALAPHPLRIIVAWYFHSIVTKFSTFNTFMQSNFLNVCVKQVTRCFRLRTMFYYSCFLKRLIKYIVGRQRHKNTMRLYYIMYFTKKS